MKTYRELYFRGPSKQLSEFIDHIGQFVTDDWKLRQRSGQWKDYLLFEYKGVQVDKALVSIYVGDRIVKGQISVGNIVPIEKNELNVDEYNTVLLRFYNDIIKPYKEHGTTLDISQPSDDIFDPNSAISSIALNKLRAFCLGANKSTGSSHPSDRKRWLDFICQTVDDGRMFDFSTLANFLQDETYWGKRPDGFIGVIGDFAWDKEQAYELAVDYENLCEVLQYYKKTRGI